MVRFMRTAKIAAGKGPEALQFAVEVVDYLAKNIKGAPKVTVYLETFGDFGAVHWHSDHESLAALEEVRNQMMADAGYMEMENKSGAFFQEGATRDKLVISFP